MYPLALVEGTDADRAEGSAFFAMVVATRLEHACQCPPGGVGAAGVPIWAPSILKYVLDRPHHDLYKYAVHGEAPPLTTPQTRAELSAATKEGMDKMSKDAKKRDAAGKQKGSAKSGVYQPGKANINCSTKDSVLARLCAYRYALFIFEALECIRDSRKPAQWAAQRLSRARLQRVGDAGLTCYEFECVLPEEKKKGIQGFDIEGFKYERPEGTRGTSHVGDWVVDTQRGDFAVYDVAVALDLFGENERPPALPWVAPANAPTAVKALIARALAWSPLASQPSPPPAKKPRSEPRRSARLKTVQ